jgi:GT2 family glycosyltransferase
MSGIRRDRRIGWAYGDFDEMDGLGRIVTKRYLREHGVTHPKSSLHACISHDLMVIPSASLLRADAYREVGGFDVDLSGYEDDDLFIRMFRAGWDHHYVDRTVTRFRIHAGSSSNDRRFVSSRLVFARKLRETIEDDARLRRYYYRDVIAPRLFQQCLDDYVRHVSAKNWTDAVRALEAMNEFARERSDIHRKSWKLRLMQKPQRLRAVLVLQDHLPRRLRFSSNPAMRLR